MGPSPRKHKDVTVAKSLTPEQQLDAGFQVLRYLPGLFHTILQRALECTYRYENTAVQKLSTFPGHLPRVCIRAI